MPKLIYKGLEVGGVSNEAIQCHFDNTGSNITSDNVEAALKELDSKTAGLIQVTPEEYEALSPEEKASGLYIIIDNKLSADSGNPVQNKVIANAINTLSSNMFSTMPKEGITNANTKFTGIAWNSNNIENCPLNNGLLYSIYSANIGFQLFIGYQNSGIWYRDTTNTMGNNWIKIG